jgi:DNA-binding protein H-NS
MGQTYLQIQQQIEKLQRQAELLRAREIKGVVDRIKVAIEHYGLTAQQLGLSSGGKATRKAKDKAGPIAATTAKFSDGKGNVWVGRGPRPHWLRDALSAGRTLEEFSADAQSQGAPAATAGKPVVAARRAKQVKPASTIRYRDEAGHAWSGRGPKPGWLKAALDAGKSLEDFAAR